jgi:WD40 repeat protein
VKQGEEPTLDAQRVANPAGAAPAGTVFGPDPSTIAPDALRPADAPDLPVVEPGHYKIIGEHARGGMGRVLIARDERLGRLVAIKELLSSEKDMAVRFLREVMLTARLQHPSIVPIHEAGQWPSGKPFYAMKLVSGRPLGELIRSAKNLAERMGLLRHMVDVAEAIAYAHSMRILHRDLKPSNVIVGDFGETVVIDWGLAKDISNLDGTAPDKLTAHTVQGAVVGTPGYMPPEQAYGRAVDERADVYALGSLLYTVLAGRPPYEGSHPPDLVAQVKAGSPVPLAERDKEIPPDLCAIVEKAMARDPAERYPTARELVEDLKRFVTGQLVAARAYTRTELWLRWIRRNRFAVSVVAAAACAVVVVGALSFARILAERDRADRERTDAVAERRRAEAAREREAARVDQLTIAQAQAYSDADPTTSLAWLKRLRPRPENARAARLLAAEAYIRSAARMILISGDGGATDVAFSPAGGFLAVGTTGGNVRLWNLTNGAEQSLKGQPGPVRSVRFSLDGRQLAAAGGDKTVRVWDVGSGGNVRTLVGHSDVVEDIDYAPGGKVLASGGRDGTIRLWDVASGQPVGLLRAAGPVRRIAYSPDGKRLAARLAGGMWTLDVAGGTRLLEGSGAFGAAGRFGFDSTGARVAAGTAREAATWDAATGRILTRHPVAADSVAFSPDGGRLAAAAHTGAVTLVDLETGAARELADAGNDASLDVAFSPDGRYLAATHGPASRIWNLETGDMRKLRAHSLAVVRVAFAASGKQLVTASVDGTVRLWPVGLGEPEVTRLEGRPATLTTGGNGTRLAIVRDGGIWLGDATGGGALLAGSTGGERKIRLSPDGQTLAATTDDASVRVWDLSSGKAQTLSGHRAPVTELAFSPDGTRLATAGGDGTVRVWDVAAGDSTAFEGHASAVTGLAFPSDDTVVSAGDDATVRVWNVRTGQSRTLRGHEAGIARLAAQGDALASYGRDRQLRRWSLATGEGRLLREIPAVGDLAFSPTGRVLAVSELGERQVYVWDGDKPRSYLEKDPVARLAFLDDDLLVVGATNGGLWLRASGGSLAPLLGHRGPVVALAVFSRTKAATLASMAEDGTLRVWTDPVPTEPAALRAWLDAITTAEVGEDDRVAGAAR